MPDKRRASDPLQSTEGHDKAGHQDRDGHEVNNQDENQVAVDNQKNNDNNNNGDDDDDNNVGPTLPSTGLAEAIPSATKKRKRRKVVLSEKLYESHLPQGDRYARSYMHRDQVSFVTVTASNHFLITTSQDGFVKFWNKKATGIEFVKQYRPHTSPITACAANGDGSLFATICATDRALKAFDVANFDLFTMIQLDFTPRTICWVQRKGQTALVAISDADTPSIHIFDVRGDGSPIHTLTELHAEPIILMAYNSLYHCVVSCDKIGNLEYWTPDGNYNKPDSVFTSKAATDLYEFRKSKSIPSCLTMSPDNESFATIAFPDREIRLFKFRSGKIRRKYDESLAVVSQMHESGTAMVNLDDIEFGKRLATERELEKQASALASANVIFDESGLFIMYATMLGVKVVNTSSNVCVKVYGKDERMRPLHLALYQGAPQQTRIRSLAMAASDNPLLTQSQLRDPILFTTSFRSNRFYLFSTAADPSSSSTKSDRDAFNEKPTAEDLAAASGTEDTKLADPLPTGATLHTSIGDIRITLFPTQTPKTVENFAGLARQGYYARTIFHRVIRQFMIQGGDPEGNGTGGASLWSAPFADEIRLPHLRHEKYTLAMANAGPNTNGSQFFITTAETPHLDGKHTVFGRVTAGFDVVHKIEGARTAKLDRPLDPVEIHSVEVY